MDNIDVSPEECEDLHKSTYVEFSICTEKYLHYQEKTEVKELQT